MVVGKGQMGSALMGSLQISCFVDTGDFWGTPVKLLVFSQKCQGVPFSPICQNGLLLQRPISVDHICPQTSLDGVWVGVERTFFANLSKCFTLAAAPAWPARSCDAAIYIYIYIYTHISLSLSLYIYIYMYT